MIAEIPISTWINGASGVLLVCLGLFVSTLKPRRNVNVGLAATTVGSGLGWFLNNLGLVLPVGSAARAACGYASVACFAVAVLGVARLVRVAPTPWRRDDRRIGAAAAVVALAYATLYAWVPVATSDAQFILPDVPGLNVLGLAVSGGLFTASWVGAAVFWALRHPRAATREEARALAILSTSLALYPLALGATNMSWLATSDITAEPWTPAIALSVAAAVAFPIGFIALWLANTRARESRIARNTALALMVVALLVVLPGVDDAAVGFARVVGVLVLAVAILRGQLPGLDVRLRFAVSRSTIAAVFIAVFFVASEAAQQFFGETIGSAYLGIAAAGALVFAIAPLQRAADRLAARAVPVEAEATTSPAPAGAQTALDASAIYRAALRAALTDGPFTREKERHLAEVQDHVRISAQEALRLREEVVAEFAKRPLPTSGGERIP